MKFLSILNPLLMFIKDSEFSGVMLVGRTVVTTKKYYDDNLSKKSPNEIARSVQQALNLIIKKCNDGIAISNKMITKSI